MMSTARNTHRGRPWGRGLLLACVLALVGVQWVGLQHRLQHGHGAGWIDSAGRAAHAGHRAGAGLPALANSDGHDHAHDDHCDDPEHDHAHDGESSHDEHNCAAIDALSLGDGPPAAGGLAPPSRPLAGLVRDAARTDARTTRARAFQARAPPFLYS